MNPHRPAGPSENPHSGDGPAATYVQVDKLTTMLDRVRAVLDESARCVDQAKQALSPGQRVSEMLLGGVVERRLQAAAEQLEQMAELVHAAMQNQSISIGSPALARARPVTLGEALEHASAVVGPLAAKHGITIRTEIGPGLSMRPAGSLYTVVLNGLQNAVESVARRGGSGTVDVGLRHDRAPSGMGYGKDGRDWLVLEIEDDGVGCPVDGSRVFDLGYTTKAKGAGVGLAVARSVVKGMGGMIELNARDDERSGAVLRVRFPSIESSADLKLGGAA